MAAPVWQSVCMPTLYLAQRPEADRMLATDPLALLIGMLLDQQIPLEKAFTGPYVLAERLGVTTLDVARLAAYDPAEFVRAFATPPALHRFPAAMAERTQRLCQVLLDDFDGDAASVWTGAKDGRDLVARIGVLPGFGKAKAQIFAALLGKQFGVRPPGWREATGGFGEEGSYRSVADIVDRPSLERVREYKKQLKAAAKAAQA
jgi:uncharacterized HhH-GPD family protein